MKLFSKYISISLIFCFIFQSVCFAAPVLFHSIRIAGTVTEATPVTVRINGFKASVVGNQFTLDNYGLIHGSNTLTAKAVDSSGNASTHQISVTYNSNNPATTYIYDANGNLTQKISGLITETFTYDYENRLKTYSAPGQSASYTYNGEGQRIAKTVNGITTSYYYDGPELILERTGANSIYYVHSNRIDEVVCDSRGYSYHSDGLGSITNLTDSAGLNANTYNYKAFGSIRSQSGTVANAWRYTGRQYDAESGLYFYRNRYYDAGVGRFITRDPIGFAGGMNLYGYVLNNPTNFIDPWGLEPGSTSWWENTWNAWSDIVIVDPWSAELIAKELVNKYPTAHNDLGDAMRHAEWSKRMAEEINQLTSFLVGWGHELDNMFHSQPWIEMQMDINNNRAGRDAAWNGTEIDPNNLTTIYPSQNNGPY